MKIDKTTIILVIILLAGLSLLLYPTFADYWNSFTQTKAVTGYVESVAQIDDKQYEEIWEAARQYNQALYERANPFFLPKAMKDAYYANLDVSGNGIMGYVEIPSIDVDLPIYHGTEETVLQIAVGHLDWTSLPVGGENTHCVVSGHRGLPSARLFTDVDQLVVGDLFMLYVLDEVLTYEIDQIKIVEPHEIEDLKVIEGEDHCTLVTCTPYGINSHRLLIRGIRTENVAEVNHIRVTADAVQVEPLLVACFLVVPLAIIGIAMVFAFDRSANRKKKRI